MAAAFSGSGGTGSRPTVVWYERDDFCRALEDFHDRFAAEPTDLLKAKCACTEIMTEIDKHFRNLQICHHLEYTGSCYEGTCLARHDGIRENSHNFDVLLVIDNRAVELEVFGISGRPGYANIKIRNSVTLHPGTATSPKYTFFGFLTQGGFLDPGKMTETFYKELEKCVSNSEHLRRKTQVSRSGSNAVILAVYLESEPQFRGPPSFGVSFTPAYEIKGELYVAQPLAEESMPSTTAFRRSFAVKEKNKTQYNGSMFVKTFVTLKAFRNLEPELSQLTSYHIRTALMWTFDKESMELNLAQWIFCVLRQLHDCLRTRRLPHYFLTEKNLLEHLDALSADSLQTTIDYLLTYEHRLMRVLTPWQQNKSLCHALGGFLQRNTQWLDKKLTESNDQYTMYTSMIEKNLQRFFRCQFEHCGNLWNGVGVSKTCSDDDLDYEILVKIDCHKNDLVTCPSPDGPEMVYLEPRSSQAQRPNLDSVLRYYTLFGVFTGDVYVDATKTAENCYTALRQCIETSNALKGKIHVLLCGQSIKIGIYPWSGDFLWGRRLCSVDLIPAYDVGGNIYVARSANGDSLPDYRAWSRSFALEERQLWSACNIEADCRKQIFRILQLLRHHSSVLSELTPHHLKTVVFMKMSEPIDWSHSRLAERFLAVLDALSSCLEKGKLPDHFLPEVNLVRYLSPNLDVQFLYKFIRRLGTDETLMLDFLSR